MPQQDVSITKLNRENPDYGTFKTAWGKIELLVECGERLKMNAQEMLTKRPKEPTEIWNVRLQHFTSTPILGVALGWYRSALFRRQPEVDTPTDKFYTAFMENCDRAGTKFIDQAKTVFDHLMMFGRAWIMVDAPSPDNQPQSLLEEQLMGLDSPYTLVVDPKDVIDWQTDDFGNLNWVLTRTVDDSPAFLSDDKPKVVYAYYDRQEYRRYEVEIDETIPMTSMDGAFRSLMLRNSMATLVAQGPHALSKYNVVPFKMLHVPTALWLANRVYLMCINYLDTENTHSWNLHQANLAMPILYSDSDPQLLLSEVGMIKLGEKDRFGWTEPDGKSFHASEERLNALREEIFRCVYLIAAGRSSNSTASMQSGFSKTLDWAPANDILNAYGNIMRAGMEGILKMVAFARQDQSATFYVRGFKFETKDATISAAIAEEISAAFAALGAPMATKTLRIELMKFMARDSLEDSGEDVLKKVVAEIEALPDPVAAMADATDQAFQQSFVKAQDRQATKSELEAGQE